MTLGAEYVAVSKAGHRLGVSRSTVLRLIDNGVLKARQHAMGRKAVEVDSLNLAIKMRKEES